MYWDFSIIYNFFSGNNLRNLLSEGQWGLEKETLRVTGKGDLALTGHPCVFGDKIENTFITTDFSESQLELVTPVFESIEKSHEFLKKLQVWVEHAIGSELLWPLSMPGPLPEDRYIPVARYNNTKKGKEKEIYRKGLALRYGKKMQMISGIHYNYSFHSDLLNLLRKKFAPRKDKKSFNNEIYMSLARNFLRNRWLLIYLFGASPVFDESSKNSLMEKFKKYEKFCSGTDDLLCYIRSATSLRMSRFGYENSLQNSFNVSYNKLAGHINDLRTILSTKNNKYSSIGLFHNGEQVQLNDRLLQLENEYYSPVRFKQSILYKSLALNALEERGIEYLELRAFDIDPFEKTGIGAEQLYFIHIFLLFCLFEESDFLTARETELNNSNAQKTSLFGRLKGCELSGMDNNKYTIREKGDKIFHKLHKIAMLLDKDTGNRKYEKIINNQFKKLTDISLIPSSRIVNEMKFNYESYREFGIRKANEHLHMNGFHITGDPKNSFVNLTGVDYFHKSAEKNNTGEAGSTAKLQGD